MRRFARKSFVIIPNQVRAELSRNLLDVYLKELYQLVQEAGVRLDYEQVSETYIRLFENKGLKKGDAIIGGFCEWQKVDIIIPIIEIFCAGYQERIILR